MLFNNSLAFNNWKIIVDAVNEQTHFTDADYAFPRTFYGSWIPRNNNAHLAIYAGILASEVKTNSNVAVCAVLNDERDSRTDKYEQEWNGLWRFHNLMQFSEKFVSVASTGMTRMDYMVLPVTGATDVDVTADTVVVDSAWDDIKSILFDDDAKAFVDVVKDTGIPAPAEDHIGYEVEGDDGEVIATVEIAWPDRKIGFMTAEQIEDRSVLEDLGWKIVTLIDAADAATIFRGDN